MPSYKIITFYGTQGQNDLLVALLDNFNFDSFEEIDEQSLKAYVLKENFDKESFVAFISSLEIFENVSYDIDDLADKNWNEVWESSFHPIIIGEQCTVRAPFHPASQSQYEIIIEPRMAFGTGHHATTSMVLEMMLSINFSNKTVLDFGCGTGILSILAEKMGAQEIQANDIEEPAYLNTMDNSSINACAKIVALWGDVSVVPQKLYDIILANVTTNTIQENIDALNYFLKKEGEIIFSGILNEQKQSIKDLAQSLNFKLVCEKNLDNWVALHYIKL